MNRFSRSILLACLLLSASSIVSAPAEAVSPWTIDDILHQEDLEGVALSGDGRWAAFAVSRWEEGGGDAKGEKRRTQRLFLADLGEGGLGSGDAIQLTYGGERIGGLAFSPDGRSLAFMSDRDVPGVSKAEGPQLWLLPLGGGEARPLTKFTRGIQSFDWIDDDSLLVARDESAGGLELRRESVGDTASAVDDPLEAPPVRLWRVPVKGEATRATTNDDWIQEFDVDPSGMRAVVYAGTSLSFEFDAKSPPAAWIVDLATGDRTSLDVAGSRSAFGFHWAPDGKSVWFSQQYSSHPIYTSAAIGRPVRWDASTGTAQVVDIGWERGLGGTLLPVPGGALGILDDGVFSRPALIPDGGTHRTLGAGSTGEDLRFVHGLLAASDDGRTLLLNVSASDRPEQLYAARLDASLTKVQAVRQLSKLNESFSGKPMPKVEVVHFTGADSGEGPGDEVEGLLHYPVSWSEGDAPAPLILSPHGGPAGHDRHAWDQRTSYPNLLWQERGAFVLEVNYHGSDGYGLDWVESIENRYYELEIPDLQAGVDYVIARGLADPDRLAVAGWSNGGILAAKIITVTDRYKAAIIGAADVEWVSDWANVDFGAAFDNYYFGGPPWERLEHYLEKSPFFQLPEVTTPSLVHTGSEDRSVPPHQSWSIFRVMQQVGKTDVRLLTYPGEGHGLRKYGHQRRKIEEDVAWMERYLFGTADRDETFHRAVPDDSQLAARLALAEAARTAGRYGVETGGVLVPELVPIQVGDDEGGTTLDVGRFEVTRAQWAAFDPAYDVASAEGDLPVTGVSLDQAKRYAAWLGERLGREVRLPTVEEAETLAGAAGAGGNTLDRWLGRAANPDDAAILREGLAERKVSLLEPVGAGAPHCVPDCAPPRAPNDAPAVFDLDGNAAEWATDGESGRAVGPSADRSSDEADRSGTPSVQGDVKEDDPQAQYVGLRVVADPAG